MHRACIYFAGSTWPFLASPLSPDLRTLNPKPENLKNPNLNPQSALETLNPPSTLNPKRQPSWCSTALAQAEGLSTAGARLEARVFESLFQKCAQCMCCIRRVYYLIHKQKCMNVCVCVYIYIYIHGLFRVLNKDLELHNPPPLPMVFPPPPAPGRAAPAWG